MTPILLYGPSVEAAYLALLICAFLAISAGSAYAVAKLIARDR
jgi:hypothetical protein